MTFEDKSIIPKTKMDRSCIVQEGTENEITKFRILRNLTLISMCFLLTFTAYDGLIMLQSTINKIEGIGVITSGAGFLAYCLSSLFVPKYVIKRYGCKMALVVSLASFVPLMMANFYPTWLTLLPACLLIGTGAAPLGGAQGTYFNVCAFKYWELTEKQKKRRLCSQENTAESDKYDGKNAQKLQEFSSYILLTMDEDIEKAKLIENDLIGIGEEEHTNYHQLVSGNSAPCKNSKELVITEYKNKENRLRHQAFLEKNGSAIETAIQGNMNGTESLSKFEMVKDSPSSTHISINPSKKLLDSAPASSLETVTARFFSCHAIAFYSAQVLSNLMTHSIMRYSDDLSEDKPYECSCGASYCDTDPLCSLGGSGEGISKSARFILCGSCLFVAAVSVVLIFFLDPLENNFKGLKNKEPVKMSLELALATLKHCRRREQIYLTPIAFYVGLFQGFYTADLTKAYVACAWGTSRIGEVCIGYGIACVVGALVAGYLVKFMGRIPIFLIVQVLNIITLAFLLIWTPDTVSTYKFFLAAALFGFITGVIFPQSLAFYGVFFKEDQEAAFASFFLFSSLGWSTSLLFSGLVCTWLKIYALLFVSFVATIGYLLAERMFGIKKKEILNLKS